MSLIHPTAVIADGAEVDKTARIGPFCVIGKNVKIGAESVLEAHVVIDGYTTLGKGNHIYPFASLGQPPQDLKFKGENTQLILGDNNTIREYVTMNPGTEGGGGKTVIGDGNLFMALAHIAHDCIIGNNCVFANNATMAGHVEVGDHAVLGGLCGVHQFVRIGRHAIVGGASGVAHDVIPYGSVIGNRAHLGGLNLVGLKRRGFSRDVIHKMRQAYRMLFSTEGTLADRIKDVNELFPNVSEVTEILDFILDSKRGVCTPQGKYDNGQA